MSSPVERVAIVGANGHVGRAFTEALLKTGKHTITALCRPQSASTLPKGVKAVPVDYEDEQALVEALKGQQFLIITLSVTTPNSVHTSLVQAATKAGVSYIMPNVYGGDGSNEQYAKETVFGELVRARIQEVAQTGVPYVAMACGFWYEWSLALGEPWFGFTIKDRKVTFFDDGEEKISVSTWANCGAALAAVLSLPESGAKPALEDWKNKPLYTASFEVSQRDMLDSLHRVLGTTDADWDITHESTKERYERGMVELKQGKQTGFATVMYTRSFYPTGDGNFHHRDLVNRSLDMPEEKLDDATKRAVDMVESGWTPF